LPLLLRLDLPPTLHQPTHPPLTPSASLPISRPYHRTTSTSPLQRNHLTRKTAHPTPQPSIDPRTQCHHRSHNRCRDFGDSPAGSQCDTLIAIRHHRSVRTELGNPAVQMLDITMDYIWASCRVAVGEHLLADVDFTDILAGCQDFRAGCGG